MSLGYEELEKLHEELNALFDKRVKERIDESFGRFIPYIDQLIKDRFNCISYDSEMSKAMNDRIKRDAERAADHYIRLFGGAPALREVVERLWDTKSEEYIAGEVHRRLNAALKKLQETMKGLA